MMQAGATLNMRDANNRTAADLARELNQRAVYDMLIAETGGDTRLANGRGMTALFDA